MCILSDVVSFWCSVTWFSHNVFFLKSLSLKKNPFNPSQSLRIYLKPTSKNVEVNSKSPLAINYLVLLQLFTFTVTERFFHETRCGNPVSWGCIDWRESLKEFAKRNCGMTSQFMQIKGWRIRSFFIVKNITYVKCWTNVYWIFLCKKKDIFLI